MKATQRYSDKASLYARYRWRYAPAAVESLCQQTGLGAASTLLDLGAGTGILTRALIGRAGRLLALEPNAAMRRWAGPGCLLLGAQAEGLPLANHSVDVITVAQALHWFNPAPARSEMRRALKPGGWLAIINNRGVDSELGAALGALNADYNLGAATHPPQAPRLSFYYGHERFRRQVFPFTLQQDFTAFLGGLSSAANLPDATHRSYPAFAAATAEVFARFSEQGQMSLQGETELVVGRVER